MENEEIFEQPAESQEDTAVNTTEQVAEPAGVETKAQTNWNNGRRRIEQRQSAKARIRELEARLAQYEGRDDDYSKFQKQQLEDRIGDMTAMEADAEASELAAHAEQFFGEHTSAFMENVYRYAPYVNENEPSLLKYCERPLGPILLHEWMTRMDNPQLRAQWLNMTTLEKDRVLDGFYKQIDAAVKRKEQPAKSIPVPNGGRQSPSQAPSDDFGVELGRAFNRHKA